MQLGFARDQLGFLLVDVVKACSRFLGLLAVAGDLPLELLRARVDLRLELLQLQLAPVELLRARLHLLLARRPRRCKLRLALCERLLLRRHLYPRLLELALA